MPGTLPRIGLIIAFIPLAISLIVFPFLPEVIPVHFMGSSASWSDKWGAVGIMALFFLPLLSLTMCGLFYLATPTMHCISEETKEEDYDPKHIDMIVPICSLLSLIFHILIVCLIRTSIYRGCPALSDTEKRKVLCCVRRIPGRDNSYLAGAIHLSDNGLFEGTG